MKYLKKGWKRLWVPFTLIIILAGMLLWDSVMDAVEPENPLNTVQAQRLEPDVMDNGDAIEDIYHEMATEPETQEEQTQTEESKQQTNSEESKEQEAGESRQPQASEGTKKASQGNGKAKEENHKTQKGGEGQSGTRESEEKPTRESAKEPEKEPASAESPDGVKTTKEETTKEESTQTPSTSSQDKDTPQTWNPSIVTDLADGKVLSSELEEDGFSFHAELVDGSPNMSLVVKLENQTTKKEGRNGIYLKSEKAKDTTYLTDLALGENEFTLYIKEGDKTIKKEVYTIEYEQEQASENHPDVGKGVTITTNLDDYTDNITTSPFLLKVKAKTFEGKSMAESQISVQLNGTTVKYSGESGGTVEYNLYFKPPEEGDTQEYVVTVTAVDNEGNSSFRQFPVTYYYMEEGEKIGEVTVVLDATTVGLGLLEEPYVCDLHKGQSAAYVVEEALQNWGYSINNGNSYNLDQGFYLSRIGRGRMCKNAEVPENLWEKILEDGLTLTKQNYKDSLGERDYTQGSGWMYCVNDSYPNRSMSKYYLNDGDTLYLRFTLAYGKDIGGYESSGETGGSLSSYGGTWLSGEFIPAN